jgi:hypothetical protein
MQGKFRIIADRHADASERRIKDFRASTATHTPALRLEAGHGLLVLEFELAAWADEGGAVMDFCAHAHRHGAADEENLVPDGNGHQRLHQRLGLVHHVGKFGGNIRRLDVGACQNHRKIFRQGQKLGTGQSRLSGQTVDSGDEGVEMRRRGDVERSEGQFHKPTA